MTDKNRPRAVRPEGRRSVRPPEQLTPDAQTELSSWPLAGDEIQLTGVRRLQTGEGGPLPAGRVLEIREKILRGAYDAAEVLEVVARRLLASGDLRAGA